MRAILSTIGAGLKTGRFLIRWQPTAAHGVNFKVGHFMRVWAQISIFNLRLKISTCVAPVQGPYLVGPDRISFSEGISCVQNYLTVLAGLIYWHSG